MPLAHSKVTAQGQVSVPAKVRQRLGVGPGSVIEWAEEGDHILDLLLFASFVLLMLSGIIVSESALPALGVPRKTDGFWNGLHKAVFFALLAASFWYIGSKAESIWNLGKGKEA